MEFSQIQSFFIVLVAVLGFISTVGGVINLLKGWRKDSSGKRHEEIIHDHEKRIKALEGKTKEQDDFIHVICMSLLAMINHELNNNSKDKLQSAKDELEKFLINK